MQSSEPFTLSTPSGATLHGLIDLPDRPGPRPAVVVCHGFKGFMEWGFFPYLAELLAARGLVVVRFNFSGAGVRPGEDRVSDPAAFRADTYSRELEEVLAVLAATGETIAPGRVDRGRIGLFGHSRGGGVALLAAARPEQRELRALVTWAAIADVDRFVPEQKAAWRRDGEVKVVNARTGQELALGLGLLEDVEANREPLDLTAAAGRRRAPWLIAHGTRDETVPPQEGRRLAAAARPPAELLVIPGADHTFGAKHPFVGPTRELIQAMNATQRWLLRHLVR